MLNFFLNFFESFIWDPPEPDPDFNHSISIFDTTLLKKVNQKPYGTQTISVADPDADLDPDPYVFGPPGSEFVSQRYESGSFYHQTKIVRKTLIPTVLRISWNFLSLKMM